MEATIKNLVGNYRYKVAELQDNTGYLVDLEAKAQDWVNPFGDMFIKRKCYMLSHEQLKKLNLTGIVVKGKDYTGVAIGITLSVMTFYRINESIFIFNVPTLFRISTISLIFLALILFKVKFMISRKKRIEKEIGPIRKMRVNYIKLRGHNVKYFWLKMFCAIICWGAVVSLALFIVLLDFDIMALFLYMLFLFFTLNLSLAGLSIGKTYKIS
ncbi:hypothetical protein LACPH_002123 [Lacticaseibacillus parahuelsenbergensis]|uniref:DUF443 family protein n=1 Tax=Lacticaseibacillus parahuelsenbergensis TaxID=3068305 RepID=A0ABY9L114_9LACO|nr:hypothetical protein [Lacticaseibacillus sp. NCIMB 15471]WLV77379.1 hypothetical protein LACPH_002123 [Lacticaseibacillus sp. NCIMB 15471]